MNDRSGATICSNPRYFSYFIDFVLSLNNSTCVKSFSRGSASRVLLINGVILVYNRVNY